MPELADSDLNVFHDANRRRWNAASPSWARHADSRGIWQQCSQNPSLTLEQAELEWLQDIRGKRVAVLGSGDNQVVFALTGMGAHVTSVDISEEQIAVARKRADSLCLQVEFVRADVTDLATLNAASFDLVYTGGHVAVWVADLTRFYSEAARILRPGGRLMVSEYHPFRRLWKQNAKMLQIEHDYFARGPHRFHGACDVLEASQGKYEQFEFHWTVSDYLMAVQSSGCEILHVGEFGTASEGWESVPLGGLPASLLIVGIRRK